MASQIPLKLIDNGLGVGTLAEFAADDVIPSENLPAFEAPVAAGTALQYWRGDKSWQDFNSTVRAAQLSGVAFTANSSVAAADTLIVALGKLQTQLNNRVTLTGTAAAATKLATVRTINGVNFDGTANITIVDSSAIPLTQRGAPNGVATLDASGTVPSAQLPSYVDDVIEVNTFANLPATGETGKIYVTLDPYTSGGITSSQFRWGGSAYVPIISSPGTTDAVTEGSTNLYFTTNRVRQVLLAGLSTAVGGIIAATDTVMSALGKLQYQISNLTKANVGLVNVDNTADLDKPASNPTLAIINEVGSQNLIYNSAFRKHTDGLADGFLLESSAGGTGVVSIVPSFMSANELAQRIDATGLQVSSPYRSIMLAGARRAKVAEGRPFLASTYVRGTAGMGLRMYIRAINISGAVIQTYNSPMFTFTGDVQRGSLSVPAMPAGTVAADVFYRFHGMNGVTDGYMELARPQGEIGPLSGWTEDLIAISEDVAAKAAANNPVLTGTVFKADVASFQIGLAVAGNSGVELGSNLGSATTPFFDFHSGAAPVDYDARILASGGTGVSGNGALTFTAAAVYLNADLYVNRLNQDSKFSMASNVGYNRYTRYVTGSIARWDFGVSNAAESGSNAGSDLYAYSFNDAGAYMRTPWTVIRATGETRMTQGAMSGPFKLGQYTLATVPSSAAYNGYVIDITDLPGGPKQARSNGTAWVIQNVGMWTNLTMNAGAVASTTHPPQYRIVDDAVELRGKVTLTAALAANTAFGFTTLPVGYRPVGTTTDTEVVRIPVSSATALAANMQCQVNRLGACALVSGTALTASSITDISNVRFSTTA